MAGTRGGAGTEVGLGAGTRGGVGRIAAMAIALAVMLGLVLVDAARAGTYRVAQCGWGIGVELDPAVPKTEGDSAYLHPGWCTAPPAGEGAALKFEQGLAPDNDQGVARARWVAPPGTTFAGVQFTWAGELQDGVFQVAGVDDGVEFHGVAAALLSGAPRPVAATVAIPAGAFEVRLECLLLGGPFGCVRSARSAMSLSGLTFTIADPTPPRTSISGTLLGAGWRRGTAALELGAEDGGAGVAGLEASVDGAAVLAAPQSCAVAAIEGETRATRMQPCPTAASRAIDVDTTGLADGAHVVRGCASDFGGALGCASEARIEVDNTAPAVAFSGAAEGEVTATVSDPTSGPAAGTISLRRADEAAWTDLPTTLDRGGSGAATLSAQLPGLSAGTYYFRAVASDVAGNSGSTQFRAAGTPTEIRAQAAAGHGSGGTGRSPHGGGRGGPGRHRRGIHLTAFLAGAKTVQTVDFGTAVEVRGRLTEGRGTAVAGRPLEVVARPAPGADPGPDRHRVLTDRAGRFRLRLPAGPSRQVVVSYRGGGGFGPARSRPLAVRVRAAVSLAASPRSLQTGQTVDLRGRVRPGDARIPKRGKVVAIQYLERASGDWRPALVTRTDGRGGFEVHYRFRYITGAARIRLRATALPEAGWPYTAGSSSPVTVEVHGG